MIKRDEKVNTLYVRVEKPFGELVNYLIPVKDDIKETIKNFKKRLRKGDWLIDYYAYD